MRRFPLVLALLAGCAGRSGPAPSDSGRLAPETTASWRLREAADTLRGAGIEWEWRQDRNPRHKHAEEDLHRFAVAVGILEGAGVRWTSGNANPGCAAAGICTGARYTLRHEGKDRAPDLILYDQAGGIVALVEVETLKGLGDADQWSAYHAIATGKGASFYLLIPDDLPKQKNGKVRAAAEPLGARVITYHDPVESR